MDATPTDTQLYSAYTLPSKHGGFSLVISITGFSTPQEAEQALAWIMGPFSDAETVRVQ